MHRLNVAAGKLQAVARGADGRRRARERRTTIRYAISAQAGVSQRLQNTLRRVQEGGGALARRPRDCVRGVGLSCEVAM